MLQESNRVEFKVTLNDKLEKEIVAFLNNREGGMLYIGIDDDGHPVENPDIDSMQLKIADRIKNNILPSTLGLFDIVTEEIENIPVIKIIISSGLEKPYYIKSKGMSPNGCYMRLGTSTQPMSTALIDEYYAKRIHTTLRNIPSPRQDLTFAQLKIYYQERGLELNKKFANSLEFFTSEGKYNYIAYLLADENENIANGDKNGDNDGDENKVLRLLEKEPDITAKLLSEKTGFSTRKISRIIRNLREEDRITRIGSSRKGYWMINK